MIKKMLMMAAVAVLAFGAQADVGGYSWTIDITGLSASYSLPSDLTAYLMSADRTTTYAMLTLNMFKSDWNLDLDKANATSYDTTYTAGDVKLTQKGETADAHVGVNFNTSSTDLYKIKDLIVRLEGTSITGKRRQDVGVTWAGNTTFNATATYKPEPIPEPTSGMLVFLGLAGMLLRRKRAA